MVTFVPVPVDCSKDGGTTYTNNFKIVENISVSDPGCLSRIPDKPIPDPGSGTRGQKKDPGSGSATLEKIIAKIRDAVSGTAFKIRNRKKV